jgi:hypothetical protein
VQRDSGLALVLVHPRNHRDSIKIGFNSYGASAWVYPDSIRIPVYTVRRDMGAKIGKMVPSLVGIKRPDTMPDDAQGLVRRNGTPNVGVGADVRVRPDAGVGAQNGSSTTPSASGGGHIGQPIQLDKLWCSPNPADDVAVVNFSLSEPSDVLIEVRNAP